MSSNPTEILREQAERSLRAVRQDFGESPTQIRKTGHYQAEYVQSFFVHVAEKHMEHPDA